MFTHAITRKPGRNFAGGITTANLGAPDFDKICLQHQKYVQTLKEIGLHVVELEALPDFPDAYFVEDTAVVFPEIAVITHPGAKARRGEEKFIEPALAQFRDIARIHPPGFVDGGDVLQVGRHFFIGLSDRTNEAGANQLAEILAHFNYSYDFVPVEAGLHLKSSMNFVGGKTLLLTNAFSKMRCFDNFEKIIVDEDEVYAANSLLVNDFLFTPAGFPKTRKKLDRLGSKIIEMEVSEARKMDGGLTCLSLRF